MRMARMFLCTAVAAMCTAGVASGQTTITQWTFNSNPADANTATGTLLPATGTGTVVALGGIVMSGIGATTFQTGSASDTTSAGDNSGLQTTTYPAQSTGSATAGVRFNVPTTGFNMINVAFEQRDSNTASKFFRFEYTLDGTNFINTGLPSGGVYSISTGSVFTPFTFNLGAITGANNNANFGFRVTAVFDPANNTSYTPVSGSYGTGGTVRFDLVTVEQGAPPTGACCVNGTCTGVSTEAACLSSGFNPTFGGAGTTCGNFTCPAAIGACCSGTACNSLDMASCNSISGVFNIGQTCTPNNFCDPVAACCFPTSCLLRSSTDCAAISGTTIAGSTTCSPSPCPPPPPGACCTGAACATSADPLTCFNGGGQFKGFGTTCTPGRCFVATGSVITSFDFDSNVVGTPARNLTFTAGPDTTATMGHFTATDDLFGVIDRTVNTDVRDDSASASDTIGILRSTETGRVFGVEDLLNPDVASGMGTATFTFNVAGFTGLNLTIDMAAFGNFEELGAGAGSVPDSYRFSVSIDGGAATDVFVSNIYEGVQPTYTLESGATNSTPAATSDPVAINGSIVLNRFVTFAAPISGTGSTLMLTFTASNDGAGEVFLFDNIVIRGTSGAATGACCSGATCSVIAPASCTGPNTRPVGSGTSCNAAGNNTTPCCRADYNQSGSVTVQDIFDFLSGYFTLNPQANINGAGGVTVQDIFDYLAAYFAGCL